MFYHVCDTHGYNSTSTHSFGARAAGIFRTHNAHIASAVAHACAEFMAAEAVVLDYVKAGRVDAKGFSAAHKECRNRIEDLARRLKVR